MDAGTQVGQQLDEDVVLHAVDMFRLLADETRVRIVWALLDHERSVGELADLVGKQASSVSQHLSRLRAARIVSTRRDGTFVHYRMHDEHVAQLLLDALRHAEHGAPGVPRHHLADGVTR